MYNVVGVRFKKAGKIYYFDPQDHPVVRNDYVIVETARGIEFGKAVTDKKQVSEHDVVLPLKKIVRIADQEDKQNVEENKIQAKEAYEICSKKSPSINLI